MSESVSVCQCARGPMESKEEKPTAPLLPAVQPAQLLLAVQPAPLSAAVQPAVRFAAVQQINKLDIAQRHEQTLAIFAWCSVRAASE